MNRVEGGDPWAEVRAMIREAARGRELMRRITKAIVQELKNGRFASVADAHRALREVVNRIKDDLGLPGPGPFPPSRRSFRRAVRDARRRERARALEGVSGAKGRS
jgi:hypothetical protein